MTDPFLSVAQPDIQDYILANENLDEEALILKHSHVHGVPSSVIAAQIAGRRKSKTKLNSFYQTRGIIYPRSVNLEQSSSEPTAQFKATLIRSLTSVPPKGADLTGGFGVDAYFIASVCQSLEYVEPDDSLLEIARNNHSILRAANIHYRHMSAEEFLKTNVERFDFIFIDPSRRSQSKKVFRLEQCEPDVVSLLPALLDVADYVLIKASPLLDLHQATQALNLVESIFVVAVDQECKEVLLLCSRKGSKEPVIKGVNFSLALPGDTSEEFQFTFSEEREATSMIHDPLTYLYEPHSWVLKLGAFKTVGTRFGLKKIHPSTHLYTADRIIRDFPGRIFRIDQTKPDGDWKKIIPEGRASIFVRNYPLTPEALRKKINLHEGGDKYVIGFSGVREKFLVVATRIK